MGKNKDGGGHKRVLFGSRSPVLDGCAMFTRRYAQYLWFAS